jgi:transcriptional regulator with XRE-family HTH domain
MPRIARNGLDVLIGQQLRALRKQHGLTQAELGKILGVTGQQVHKIEAGENRFYVSQARVLARRFSMSMDYFCPEPQSNRARGGPNKRSGMDMDAMMEFVTSKAGFELISAFNSLKDERTRKSVASFVKSMAEKDVGRAIARSRRKQP